MQLFKTKILFFYLLLSTAYLTAQSAPARAESAQELKLKVEDGVLVTTRDYCDFLNKTASSDEFHLYDEKMAGDLGSACIVRSGVPGSYCYQATGSEKNVASPMLFLSWNNVVRYCQWKNSAASTSTFHFNSCASSYDPDLKSNILTFCIASSGVTANQASGAAAAAGAELDEILEEAAEVIGVGVAGTEGLRGPETNEQDIKNNNDSSEDGDSYAILRSVGSVDFVEEPTVSLQKTSEITNKNNKEGIQFANSGRVAGDVSNTIISQKYIFLNTKTLMVITAMALAPRAIHFISYYTFGKTIQPFCDYLEIRSEHTPMLSLGASDWIGCNDFVLWSKALEQNTATEEEFNELELKANNMAKIATEIREKEHNDKKVDNSISGSFSLAYNAQFAFDKAADFCKTSRNRARNQFKGDWVKRCSIANINYKISTYNAMIAMEQNRFITSPKNSYLTSTHYKCINEFKKAIEYLKEASEENSLNNIEVSKRLQKAASAANHAASYCVRSKLFFVSKLKEDVNISINDYPEWNGLSNAFEFAKIGSEILKDSIKFLRKEILATSFSSANGTRLCSKASNQVIISEKYLKNASFAYDPNNNKTKEDINKWSESGYSAWYSANAFGNACLALLEALELEADKSEDSESIDPCKNNSKEYEGAAQIFNRATKDFLDNKLIEGETLKKEGHALLSKINADQCPIIEGHARN